jgi:hypothetical protein
MNKRAKYPQLFISFKDALSLHSFICRNMNKEFQISSDPLMQYFFSYMNLDWKRLIFSVFTLDVSIYSILHLMKRPGAGISVLHNRTYFSIL